MSPIGMIPCRVACAQSSSAWLVPHLDNASPCSERADLNSRAAETPGNGTIHALQDARIGLLHGEGQCADGRESAELPSLQNEPLDY